MRTSAPALALAFAVVLALTGCGPTAPVPTPSSSEGSPSPVPTGSPLSTPAAGDAAAAVDAAVIVVTASRISVFGTDGSTLVAAGYDEDAGGVAAALADVLGVEPRVSATTAESTGSCPGRTLYDFGGLVLGTPQALGSPASIGLPGRFDVVLTTTSVGVVAVETVGGQQVGATQAAFEAAIGDEVALDERAAGVGFDIVNPAADPYDQVGSYAAFEGGVLTTLITPAVVRFIGDCG